MNIIITGLGSVGKNLTDELAGEGHSVVVVDTNGDVVEAAVNNCDVKGVIGNCASKEALMEAGIDSADLLITTTNNDELNVLCCIIAKRLGVKKTIARICKPEYLTLFSNNDALGIDLMVNPQYEAAMEITRMLRFPSAIKVNEFSERKVELVEFRVPSDSSLVGLSLKSLSDNFKAKVLICAAQRDGHAIIPSGDFIIKAEDRLFLTATQSNIHQFFKQLGWNKQSRNVIIVGGSKTAFYLCKELAKRGIGAKLIENNHQKCIEYSQELDKTEIIFGDGTDQELLIDEGIASTDAFVALVDLDEQNIIMSMFAESQKVAKVITKIDQMSYYDMLQKSGIYSVVSTKISIADQIMRFVRLIGNKKGSGVRTLFRIIDDTAEILEFEAGQNFQRFGVTLQDMEIKKNLLIAGIIRDEKLITPSGKDVIKEGDSVIVVTLEEGLDNLNDILDY